MKKIVDILHDLVEDTDWNFEDLQRAGDPTLIIDALRDETFGIRIL